MGNTIVLVPWLWSWLEGYGVYSYLEGTCAVLKATLSQGSMVASGTMDPGAFVA